MKTLIAVVTFCLFSFSAFASTSVNVCAYKATEGDTCDHEIKKLQGLAPNGSVITCTKNINPQGTTYTVEVPKFGFGNLVYDVEVHQTASACIITSLTVRP